MFSFLTKKEIASYDELLMDYLLTGREPLDNPKYQHMFLMANHIQSIPQNHSWILPEESGYDIFNAVMNSNSLLVNANLKEAGDTVSLKPVPICIVCDYHDNKSRQEEELQTALEELVNAIVNQWDNLILYGSPRHKMTGAFTEIDFDPRNYIGVDIINHDDEILFKTSLFNNLPSIKDRAKWISQPAWYMHPDIYAAIKNVLKRRYPQNIPVGIIENRGEENFLYEYPVITCKSMPDFQNALTRNGGIMLLGSLYNAVHIRCQPEQTSVTAHILDKNEEVDQDIINVVDISTGKRKKRMAYTFFVAIASDIIKPDMIKMVKININVR